MFGYTIPFTTEEIEFSYIGTLHAGIDLSQVQFDINESSRTIYVTMPAPTVNPVNINNGRMMKTDPASLKPFCEHVEKVTETKVRLKFKKNDE